MSFSLRGRAFVGGRIEDDVLIEIADGKIASVRAPVHAPREHDRPREGLIIPGFVDLHVHGGAGADFMDGEPEAARTVCGFHARHGTTALAATTLSASRVAVRQAVEGIAAAAGGRLAGEAEIVAVHFEGPYINPERAGAQDRDSIRRPDPHELEEWIAAAGPLACLMTLAPEVDGVLPLIDRLKGRMRFSIGHSSADYATSLEAVRRGASHFTHLFNAMTPLHHREPGVIGAALASDETTVELIADGAHVHPVILHSIATLLPKRTVLVTDAMRACGMGDGSFRLHEYDVIARDGVARMADGTLAGSVLTMIDAVRNMVELAGLPVEMVIPLATEVPARAIGVGKRKGRIEAGCDADLVVLSSRFEIEQVFLAGREIDST